MLSVKNNITFSYMLYKIIQLCPLHPKNIYDSKTEILFQIDWLLLITYWLPVLLAPLLTKDQQLKKSY